MKKKILSVAVLLLVALATLFIFASSDNGKSVGAFAQNGYIADRDPSKTNEGLYLIYEAPGSPALEEKLVFDEESVCRLGDQEIACIALNVTIAGAFGGKRVFIEGESADSGVLVRNLVLDMESGRKFGFIRSIEKNGVNHLIAIDEVEFLSGDIAVRAGVEDTDCSAKNITDCIPSLNNDFYIRNLSTSTEVYNLLSDADIAIFEDPGSPALIPATSDELAREFADADSFMKSYTFKYLLDGATIISLVEQYTP